MAVRRVVAHGVFGAVAVLSGAFAIYETWTLVRSNRINTVITSSQAGQLDANVPEARFARAVALAQAGKSEEALKLYKSLAQGTSPEMRYAALFNVGNLYMKEGMQYGSDESFKSVPLIELAKQAYRDLLRSKPDDWDARYNLERALWLVPEIEQGGGDESDIQGKEQRVKSNIRGEPVDLP
jgi:mxaK protein